MSAFYLAFMKQLANLPISRSHCDINMLGNFCPGMLYHSYSVLQYLAIVIAFYRERNVVIYCTHLINQYYPP